MMVNKKHTPLPWKGGEDNWAIYDAAGFQVATIHAKVLGYNDLDFAPRIANSEFIIRAVNSYYQLLKELEETAQYLKLLSQATSLDDSSFAAYVANRAGNLFVFIAEMKKKRR